jgi:hypothetical protein
MSKTSAAARPILWYLLLLAIVPAVAENWVFLAFPPGSVFRFDTTWEAAYSGACIAIFLVFLGWGTRRRLVFSAFVFTLFALYFYGGSPSLDRIVSFIAYSALFGIALEFYRQNRPLYHELKASGAGMGRIVLRASLLWSPMLVFVAIGIALNYLIVETTRNALYESALIDRHCVIRNDPEDPVIPCTSLDGRLHRDQLEPLSLEENIALQVERMFLFWKKKTLEGLASVSPSKLDRKKALEEVVVLEQALRPVNMFGLEAPGAPKRPDSRSDPRVRALEKQLHVVGQQIARCQKILAIFMNPACERLKSERARLLKARNSRVSYLVKRERKRISKERADDPVKAYRGDLYRDLARIDPAAEFRSLRRELDSQFRKKAPREEIHAAMKVAVVRFMSTAEARARNAVVARSRRQPDLAYEVGVVRRLCRLKASGAGVRNGDDFECPAMDKEHWVLEPLPFRESVDRSVVRWHERSERDLERRLAQQRLAFASSAEQVKGANRELWRSEVIPRNIRLEQQDCGLNPRCHVWNWAKGAAEDAYDEARADLRRRATRGVNAAAEGGASRLNQQIDLARSGLHDALAELRRGVDSTVEEIARGGAIMSALLQLWLFLVIIKSVLYVLATEVFNVKSIPVIGLESQGDAEGAYTRSTNIEIPEDFATPLQTSTVGINQSKTTVIPQPFRASFARIIRGKWILNRGTHAENATMRFTQPGGRIGIDWRMKEGEEVVFRYGDLLGFSENVELRTTISLRLSTLLFGRYIYHSARCVSGPGRLLLSVKGDVEPAQHMVETFPLERLIAWSMHARFRVTDERTLAAVFKDGFTIRRVRQGVERNGLVLVGAPMSEEPRFHGTMRFVKTFLMPI